MRRNVNRTLQRANVFLTLSAFWRNFYVDECELSPSQVVILLLIGILLLPRAVT